MNVASRANSRAERATSASPRQTRRVAGSSRRSPTSQTVGRSTGPPPASAPSPHRPAPAARPQPRQELLERKRLHQIVVGPGVEPGDPVADSAACGEQQYRRPHPSTTQSPAHLEPVEARQHHVEHDGVEALPRCPPHPVAAGRGDLDGVSLLHQTATQQGGQPGLVLDDQHAHGALLPHGSEKRMRAAVAAFSSCSHLRLLASMSFPQQPREGTMLRPTTRVVIIAGAAVVLALVDTGAAIAASDQGGDAPIPSTAREQAEAAALAHVGQGTVSDNEASEEQGTYEVEVLLASGMQVEVQLDGNFAVVSTEEERASDDMD